MGRIRGGSIDEVADERLNVLQCVQDKVHWRSDGKAKTRRVIADLCNKAVDVENYQEIAEGLKGLDLAIVNNNAGVATIKS